MRWIWLLSLAGVVLGCAEKEWTQFRFDGANAAFRPVRTAPRPSQARWTRDIGRVTYSSPVIDEDGNVYMGNIAGEVFSWTPTGTERWRRLLMGSTTSSVKLRPSGSGRPALTRPSKANRCGHGSPPGSEPPPPQVRDV